MAGHDVTRLSRGGYGSPDHNVLSTSVEQNRILLTEDKDFGDLVYLFGLQSRGVVLFRFPQGTRHLLVGMALELLDTRADELTDSFAVVEPNGIRIRDLP